MPSVILYKIKTTMNVLHIDCSIRDDRSVSKLLSALFVSQLADKFNHTVIEYLDLSANPPAHATELFIRGNYTTPAERTEEMVRELAESEVLIEKLHNADVYVIGMPMYNFSIPSNFKAFIDNIVRIGRTFMPAETGFQGLLNNKKVFVINTRGVDFSSDPFRSMDQLQPYLKTVFGFMGLNDVTFINVHPVKWGSEEVLAKAFAKAKSEIGAAVNNL
jgi:FMN-dependent NADH-azoreductase